MRPALIALAVSLAASACGGDDTKTPTAGPALVGEETLAIVAHEGDDLRYLQPDLGDAVAAGTGVTTVYVTDGSVEQGTAKPDAEHRAVQLAYASMIGTPDAAWTCGEIQLAGQPAEHCRLDAAHVSLVFLGYPASTGDGASTQSLLHLWEAKVTSVTTAAASPATYSQVSLIAAVAAVIDATLPQQLLTLEIASTHGADHSDHMLVGALALLATATSHAAPGIAAYRGDNIASELPNSGPGQDRTDTAYGYYAACATGCAACGTACTTAQLSTTDAALIQRHYPIAMIPDADGPLMIGSDCVSLTQAGANGTIGSCTGAPSWTLDAHGTLKTDAGICMKAILTGEIVGSNCTDDGAGGRFYYDTDGHLWSGVIPGAQADMTLAHLQCVGNSGGRPRDLLCGAPNAPTVGLQIPL